jgi:tagatose-6-phosphate ketose/aldose isomerase
LNFKKEYALVDPLSALLVLSSAEKIEGGLVHTPHEIAQQPVTWLESLDLLLQREGEIKNFLTTAGIQKSPGERPLVYLVGAGTSDYIGHSLYLLLQQKWQCQVVAVASTTLLTNFEDYQLEGRTTLWISFSRSGDSSEGVAVIERALREAPDVHHLVVTCNSAARMLQVLEGAPHSFSIVLGDATNDRSLAMTSSFSNMVLTGQFLANIWSTEEYVPICRNLARAARSLLPRAATLVSELVRDGYERACFVGTGVLAGAAMESGLKLLELTAGGVQTMWQPTLALRHGPMAALDTKTLFISFLSSEHRRRSYEVDLLKEIGSKHLVGARVAVAAAPDASLRHVAEYVLTPEEDLGIPDLYLPLLDVIFGQLLGLFSSLHLGLKPDSPSPNGAINRVVENVGIY